MASQLTDEELREKLVEFGEDVGPLTITTRPLWEKRLKTLMREKRRSPVRNLNAFSSDDSEIDSSDTHRLHRKKRNSYRSTVPVINLARLELNNKHPGGTASQVSSDVFKKPVVPSPRGGAGCHSFFSTSSTISGKLSDSISRLKSRKSPTSESLNTTFDVDTSDSDFDSESSTFTRLSPRLRNQNCTEDRNGDHRSFYSQHRGKGDSNGEKSDGFLRKVISVPVRKTDNYTTPFAERWSLRSSFERRHDKPSVNGYVSVDSVLNKEFSNGKVPGKTTNYSHCVSWMLVLGTAAFFILIGTVYMSEVQKVSQNLTKNNYLSLCCKESEDEKNCIPKQYLKAALHISREVHSLLAAVAGEYECESETRRSRHMTLPDLQFMLREKISDQSITKEFDHIFVHALWLIWKHPDWQITIHWKNKNHMSSGSTEDFKHISALESVVAAKSFWCRIQHSIQWTTTELAILALVVISIFISISAVKYWKRRKEAQEREMYDLVEKIIETLQKQDEACESGSNSAVCKAVVHVRDMLIPPEERKLKQWLWDKAVNFIEENESRVRVEERHIAGEGFKVWRWLSNSTAEGEGGRHGKVWQGQAFRNLGKGCPYGVTPCLKIRNMFDPEVEYGDDWQICIQDAILEKCEGNNGIVHIAVDPTPSEGCVYLMCNSSETAGKAFNALHGWWFDGKLVTVKYLRLERYLERFPSAEHCVEPLKPSNNERLSLSAPFFSSALERS